ncbi:LysR family transcriptional regulator [Thalassococcus sp. S3]|uniref:LysR family transcriptional regulator n=1 Tax=Thalassococcus sp. S3 TaxID=2017482 RepID=UPI0010248C5B|nr:LysR family transcriptional regulator [Thalassococcus sp. S3]QBF33319.1 transcriptional regulator [Thalassococcus sp. S3]
MTLRRKSLPPLDTLIFFEACSRAGSFGAAASELYVSQAAVSKRIKQLEEWLGYELFERGARGLRLTLAGERLADPVAMSLDYLQTSLNQARVPSSQSVRIAANSAVSVFWLYKRLRSFALSVASHPVETVIADDPRDLLSDSNDVAIIYADGVPEGWYGELLMQEELAPVSSPWAARRFANDPKGASLLDYQREAPEWINWEVWRVKQKKFHDLPRIVCPSYSHSIGRALSGEGIALGSCALLAEELETGKLVVLDDASTMTGKGYFLIWQDHVGPSTGCRNLVQYLCGN